MNVNLTQRIRQATGLSSRAARTLALAIVRRDEQGVKDHPAVTEQTCGDGCCFYGYAVPRSRYYYPGFPILDQSMNWVHG